MRQRRVPPETRRLSYREGSPLQLCHEAGLTLTRHTPTYSLSCTPKERRAIARERDLLERTIVRYVLPRPAAGARAARPYLYLITTRGAHLRIHATTGVVERWRYVRGMPGVAPGWRWSLASTRGLPWLTPIILALQVAALRRKRDRDEPIENDHPEQLCLW